MGDFSNRIISEELHERFAKKIKSETKKDTTRDAKSEGLWGYNSKTHCGVSKQNSSFLHISEDLSRGSGSLLTGIWAPVLLFSGPLSLGIWGPRTMYLTTRYLGPSEILPPGNLTTLPRFGTHTLTFSGPLSQGLGPS